MFLWLTLYKGFAAYQRIEICKICIPLLAIGWLTR